MLCYYVLLCYMLKFAKFPSPPVAATAIAATAAVVAAASAAFMSRRN
jgi:hypothetical protein